MNRSASAYTGGRRPFGYRGRGSPARRGNLQMGTNRGGLQNGRGIFTKRSVEQVVNRTMSNVVSDFDRLVGRKRTEIQGLPQIQRHWTWTTIRSWHQTAGVEEPDGEHLSNILITLLLSVSAVTLLIIMKLVPPSICVCHALFFGASIISLLISTTFVLDASKAALRCSAAHYRVTFEKKYSLMHEDEYELGLRTSFPMSYSVLLNVRREKYLTNTRTLRNCPEKDIKICLLTSIFRAEGSSLSIVTLKSFKIMFYLQEGKLFLRYDDILVKMLQQEAEYFGVKSLARRLRNLEAQPGDELCMIAANERTASF